jgi:hypothetical protein
VGGEEHSYGHGREEEKEDLKKEDKKRKSQKLRPLR